MHCCPRQHQSWHGGQECSGVRPMKLSMLPYSRCFPTADSCSTLPISIRAEVWRARLVDNGASNSKPLQTPMEMRSAHCTNNVVQTPDWPLPRKLRFHIPASVTQIFRSNDPEMTALISSTYLQYAYPPHVHLCGLQWRHMLRSKSEPLTQRSARTHGVLICIATDTVFGRSSSKQQSKNADHEFCLRWIHLRKAGWCSQRKSQITVSWLSGHSSFQAPGNSQIFGSTRGHAAHHSL